MLAIVSGSMARLRLFAPWRWRFAHWTFPGGRSALCAVRCQNRVEGSVTAITFRRNSADNRRQKRLRSLYFRSTLGVRKGVAMKARPSPHANSGRNHVCAISDGCHGLALADFSNTSHVNRQVRARTRMIPMFYTTRLLVFLAVTGGLTAAIVLSLSGELITHLFG